MEGVQSAVSRDHGGRTDADLLTPAERRVVDLATDEQVADEVADALVALRT